MSLENLTDDQRNSLALKRLFGHPEFGREAKKLWKKIEPNAKFPELDLEDQARAMNEATQKELQALQEKVQLQEIQGRRAEQHAKIRQAGLEPDEVEKVMTEEKIASYDTAIKYVTAQRKLAPPTPANITPIMLPDDLKEIQKNPNAYARKAAFEAVNEIIANRAIAR
jgi:hypothetical protein